jgi:hypothetical protein
MERIRDSPDGPRQTVDYESGRMLGCSHLANGHLKERGLFIYIKRKTGNDNWGFKNGWISGIV